MIRKPKFSRHFSKQFTRDDDPDQRKIRSSSSANELVRNIKEKLRTPPDLDHQPDKIDLNRRCSDSMLTSQSSFTVLPPINNSTDDDSEKQDQAGEDGNRIDLSEHQEQGSSEGDENMTKKMLIKDQGAKDDLFIKLSDQFKLYRVSQAKESCFNFLSTTKYKMTSTFQVDKFIKLMLQKDKDDDKILSTEDVRTCLSLSSININSNLLSRLLRSSSAGDKKHYIEVMASSIQRSVDMNTNNEGDMRDKEADTWKLFLESYKNLPRY